MPSRGKISSVLHNFIGAYTSRNSDYDGYWLFGLVVDKFESLDIDLTSSESGAREPLIAFAANLAAAKFQDQMTRARLDMSRVSAARLVIAKLPGIVTGPINGRICDGHNVRFTADAISDRGKAYSHATTLFVARAEVRFLGYAVRGRN